MKYNELVTERQRKTNRVGRGIAHGQGKTAGRGTKGQGSRKSGVKAGFEGGQMPLYMRLPKLRGFKSKRPTVETIYTGQLDGLKKAVIDTDTLAKAGLISSPNVEVKLILNGEVKSKLEVKLQGASAGAVAAVTKAGGTFTKTAQLGRPATKKPKEA